MYNVLFSAKDELDIDLLVKGRSAMLRRTCPEGIDHCHCLNKPGTLAEGSLYFDEDPIQASITHITCTPGIIHPVIYPSNKSIIFGSTVVIKNLYKY